ncbi:unnamed protein product [Rotaria socialis]|uniref:WW domain-containing protein n=2 Tax=Rotaria socialis TaxID=392032 RepID=A0A817LMJ1_9BILA|nr:unnamed protein product [Rotaria socialis]
MYDSKHRTTDTQIYDSRKDASGYSSNKRDWNAQTHGSIEEMSNHRKYMRTQSSANNNRVTSNSSSSQQQRENGEKKTVKDTKKPLRSFGDWSEFKSSTGKTYFYNSKTEVSQWEKPKGWLTDELNRTNCSSTPSNNRIKKESTTNVSSTVCSRYKTEESSTDKRLSQTSNLKIASENSNHHHLNGNRLYQQSHEQIPIVANNRLPTSDDDSSRMSFSSTSSKESASTMNQSNGTTLNSSLSQPVATMFVKYVQIFRKLEQCYDQIVHPQKRRLIRTVLDGCMGRVLELKHEMISMDFSEYHYFDDILADLKLTPNDLEIPIPNYFVLERAQAIEKRERLLGQILARMTLDNENQETSGIMTMDDAIRIIQSHERARQGRLRAKQIGELRLNDQRARQRANMGESKMDKILAATIIQKYYRRYVVRREVKKFREEEYMFLGMAMPTFHKDPLKRLLADVRAHEDERRKRQEKHEITYQQALIATREKIKQTEGPDMKERLQEQIRQWFIECRYESNSFH